MKKIYYMVMVIKRQVTVRDAISGDETDVPIDKCYGYCPVFETLEEAEKHSDGKYQIVAVQQLGPTSEK